MRIAIVNVTNGGLSGGYRKYLQSILPGIESDPRIERVDLFVPPDLALVGVSDRAHSLPLSSGRPDFQKLRAQLQAIRPDIVFIPTARWFDCGSTPVVSMVRNMEPLVIPFSPRNPLEIARNLARRYAAFTSCKRSDGVIAVSSFVHEFLQTKWRVPPSRLAVIYHGVANPDQQLRSRRPESFPVPSGRRFIFTAGSIRPARGLDDAIRAVAEMLREGHAVSLVIAGAVDPGMERYSRGLKQLATELGCANDVLWLGSLDAAEMDWAFRNCAAFVMTSRAEACPNTALEAMAHGCVCISTDTPPMPEVFGDAAVYYLAGDSRSLVSALGSVMTDAPNVLSELRHRAVKRATHFSWDRTARATVDFLETRTGGNGQRERSGR
jgi:glycosyltransferase involved in cell wall biosynthesis